MTITNIFVKIRWLADTDLLIEYMVNNNNCYGSNEFPFKKEFEEIEEVKEFLYNKLEKVIE